ncbi:tRNA pseudouridine(13) synthase TruD [Candidatus Micrarchaeota archaeon]|nr:tRNA pseudouridine(13) synthase TruD [Candidatus Micrarchaeota archaeon]
MDANNPNNTNNTNTSAIHCTHLSTASGIGGSIKTKPEDFVVEEILEDGTILELNKAIDKPELKEIKGNYLHFVLQKTNWSTSSAISEIANRTRVSQRLFNVAGTKDKLSISTQLASVKGVKKETLISAKIKDISINGAWYASDKVRLGHLLGNRFTITVRNIPVVQSVSQKLIQKIQGQLGGKFPNYFGKQRFGSTRKNTHIIGQKMLKGDFETAVNMFLCDSSGEENAFASDARKQLKETGDYLSALKTYPKHLRLERTMIAYLERKPTDYVGALKSLPRNNLMMFVHAFQSHLFNELLSQRIKKMQSDGLSDLELEKGEYFCGETNGFPDPDRSAAEGWIVGKLVGYGSPANECECALLEKYSVKKDSFKIPLIPEIASKGGYRTLFAPLKDFSFNVCDDSAFVFRFLLPAGSYATVAMREFLDLIKF